MDFNGTDGSSPNGSLTLSGNILYGMTYNGSTKRNGNIFSINTDGSGYKDLFDFAEAVATGGHWGSLTLSGNMLYGMETGGGASGYVQVRMESELKH